MSCSANFNQESTSVDGKTSHKVHRGRRNDEVELQTSRHKGLHVVPPESGTLYIAAWMMIARAWNFIVSTSSGRRLKPSSPCGVFIKRKRKLLIQATLFIGNVTNEFVFVRHEASTILFSRISFVNISCIMQLWHNFQTHPAASIPTDCGVEKVVHAYSFMQSESLFPGCHRQTCSLMFWKLKLHENVEGRRAIGQNYQWNFLNSNHGRMWINGERALKNSQDINVHDDVEAGAILSLAVQQL